MKYDGRYRAAKIWHREQRNYWTIMLYNEIDAQWIERMRARRRQEGKPVPSYTAYAIRAIATAMDELRAEFPEINSYLRSIPFPVLGVKKIHTFENLSCGFSKVVTKDGEEMVVPGYIPSPHEIGLEQIDSILRNAGEQSGVASFDEVKMYYRLPGFLQRFLSWMSEQSPAMREKSRGTFNFTSLAKFGIESYTVPQSTSYEFGMGAVKDKALVRDGQLVAGRSFTMIGAFDRRMLSGKPAALVMKHISAILQSARCDEGYHQVELAAESRPRSNAF